MNKRSSGNKEKGQDGQVLTWRQHFERNRKGWNELLLTDPSFSSGVLCPRCEKSFLASEEKAHWNANSRECPGVAVCNPCGTEEALLGPKRSFGRGKRESR